METQQDMCKLEFMQSETASASTRPLPADAFLRHRGLMKTNTGAAKPQRIPALDFTKGALVLFMVLYHWLNYFIGPEGTYYRYLRFLTPSFILITGFIISHVYLSKYSPDDPRLPKRLFIRALKLMAVFIALNVARVFIVPALGTGVLVKNPFNLANIFTIFISGNCPASGGKLVSFFILLPISYVLLFAGALMLPYRFYRHTFYLVWFLLLVSIAILKIVGVESQNLELVTIGMLGVVIGFTPITTINRFVSHPYLLVLAYALYTVAITEWNVPYPLETIGVCLSVTAIYLVGTVELSGSRVRDTVILLGKYSLFGYISQIAILQAIEVGLGHLNLEASKLVASFVGAIALTVISVEVVDRARVGIPRVDRVYKAVFN